MPIRHWIAQAARSFENPRVHILRCGLVPPPIGRNAVLLLRRESLLKRQRTKAIDEVRYTYHAAGFSLYEANGFAKAYRTRSHLPRLGTVKDVGNVGLPNN